METYTFSYIFDRVITSRQSNNLNNVVHTLHWRFVGTRNSDGETGEVSYITRLPEPDPGTFVESSNIDHNTLVQWLEASPEINPYLEDMKNAMINHIEVQSQKDFDLKIS